MRGVLRQTYMTSTFHGTRCSPCENHRQWLMVVLIAVAHAAPEKYQRMIEQVSVSVRRGLQLLEEVREHAVMIRIQLGKLIHIGPHVGVMRKIVEAIADVRRRKCCVAEFVSQHQR